MFIPLYCWPSMFSLYPPWSLWFCFTHLRSELTGTQTFTQVCSLFVLWPPISDLCPLISFDLCPLCLGELRVWLVTKRGPGILYTETEETPDSGYIFRDLFWSSCFNNSLLNLWKLAHMFWWNVNYLCYVKCELFNI